MMITLTDPTGDPIGLMVSPFIPMRVWKDTQGDTCINIPKRGEDSLSYQKIKESVEETIEKINSALGPYQEKYSIATNIL